MKIIRFLLIISILLPFFQGMNAQDSIQVMQPEPAQTPEPATAPVPVPKKEKAPIKDKIYFGGNIGLSFGNYTMIGIRPFIGYKIRPKLSIGLKFSYEYISDKRYSSTYTTSNYGGSVFARYRIVNPLYVHAEYALMNYELYNSLGESQREWVPFLLLGAGYSQSLGGRTWLNIQILFDVLQNSNSPYNNWEPFYSVGVGVGF